jgi:hypothetical protein
VTSRAPAVAADAARQRFAGSPALAKSRILPPARFTFWYDVANEYVAVRVLRVFGPSAPVATIRAWVSLSNGGRHGRALVSAQAASPLGGSLPR